MSLDKPIRVSQDDAGRKVFTLCGCNNCCPTVTVEKDGTYVLKDDFGGTVILTSEQFALLKNVKD